MSTTPSEILDGDFNDDIREAYEKLKGKADPYFDQFKNKTFREFWDLLPNKLDYFDYEEQLEKELETNKYIWIKKEVGLGITEFMLRWIAWSCFNKPMKNVDVDVVLITAPRLELAIQLMDRIKELFNYNFTTKNTVCILNGHKIEAFPSHHLATARGLNPSIVLLEEADFFPPHEQEEARVVSERYITKSNPSIIMVSTPNLPLGLYDKMEREEPSMYKKLFMLYPTGLNKIYTPEAIAEAMKSPSFAREHEGKYGFGIGDIFPSDLVYACVKPYSLAFEGKGDVLTVDPAYGSSKFAYMGLHKVDGITYIREAFQLARASPSAMTDLIVERSKFYRITLVDSAHAGLIRDLIDRGVNAHSVVFGAKVDPKTSLLSKMTMESAQMVREERARIHPTFKDFISQLIAVKFNEKGHPDKTELTFDLGDCFLMGANYLKNSKVTIIKV